MLIAFATGAVTGLALAASTAWLLRRRYGSTERRRHLALIDTMRLEMVSMRADLQQVRFQRSFWRGLAAIRLERLRQNEQHRAQVDLAIRAANSIVTQGVNPETGERDG